MSLSEPVALVLGSLVTGLLTGGPAIWLGRRRKAQPGPSPDRVEAALNSRVAELDERLSAQYESRITDRDRTIAYLEAQCENKDRAIAALQKSGRRND